MTLGTDRDQQDNDLFLWWDLWVPHDFQGVKYVISTSYYVIVEVGNKEIHETL